MSKEITFEEVAKHNTPEDLWIVVRGKVYDVTKYLEDHPGGPVVLTNRAGKEVTKPFEDAGHSDNAQKKMKDFQVGVIKEGSLPMPGQVDGESNLNLSKLALVAVGILVAYIMYAVFAKSPQQQ